MSIASQLRICCLVLPFALLPLNGIAQDTAWDVLTKRNGDVLEVLIVENKPDEILYRKRTDPEGPIYGISKSELLSVRYRDGKTESFTITMDQFYDEKPSPPVAPPAQNRYAARPPRNAFEESVLALPSHDLPTTYDFYRKQANNGKLLGLTGTVLQIAINTIGLMIITNNTDSYGHATNQKAVNSGVRMIVAGSVTGLALGPIGFIKWAKNGRKSSYVKKEMQRRRVEVR